LIVKLICFLQIIRFFKQRIEKHQKLRLAKETFEKEYSRIIKEGQNVFQKKPWTEDYYNYNFTVVINNINQWYLEIKEKQNKSPLYKDPIINNSELEGKIRLMKKELMNLDKIPQKIVTKNKMKIEDMIGKISIEDLIKQSDEETKQTNNESSPKNNTESNSNNDSKIEL